eukprot:TRINITY_DN19707_c0_g1_i4.p1 TRINITY_DN19707_c0_g1~~TRINITY_DN19707_c0_g1_i4.p1  ORF type:complete len:464 (+),score=89.08 TRINITY_DN19707_c0_g1_i4:92-1483(+)
MQASAAPTKVSRRGGRPPQLGRLARKKGGSDSVAAPANGDASDCLSLVLLSGETLSVQVPSCRTIYGVKVAAAALLGGHVAAKDVKVATNCGQLLTDVSSVDAVPAGPWTLIVSPAWPGDIQAEAAEGAADHVQNENVVDAGELARSYEDAVRLIGAAAGRTDELPASEQAALSAALQSAVSLRRRALVAVSAQDGAAEGLQRRNTPGPEKLAEKKKTLEHELTRLCTAAIACGERQLLVARHFESLIFFRRLVADQYRYMSMVSVGDPRRHDIEKCKAAYQRALSDCSRHLPVGHPFRAAVVLNYAVFCHDVLEERSEAIKVADGYLQEVRATPRAAMPEASFDEAESAPLLDVLQENLAVWSGERAWPEPPVYRVVEADSPQRHLAAAEGAPRPVTQAAREDAAADTPAVAARLVPPLPALRQLQAVASGARSARLPAVKRTPRKSVTAANTPRKSVHSAR